MSAARRNRRETSHDDDHVHQSSGEAVEELNARVGTITFDHFETPEHFCAYYKEHFGPTVAAYRLNQDDPERLARLDRDFLQFARDTARTGDDGRPRYDGEYLLAVARKS